MGNIIFVLFSHYCDIFIRGGNRTANFFVYPLSRTDLQNYRKCPIRIEIILLCHVVCSFSHG